MVNFLDNWLRGARVWWWVRKDEWKQEEEGTLRRVINGQYLKHFQRIVNIDFVGF